MGAECYGERTTVGGVVMTAYGGRGGMYYGPLDDGHNLVFDFDYGLLRDIRVETSAVEEHKGG